MTRKLRGNDTNNFCKRMQKTAFRSDLHGKTQELFASLLRLIVVEFDSRQFRDIVLALAKQKKRTSNGPGLKIDDVGATVFINEHLTPANKTLFREARQWSKDNDFKYVSMGRKRKHINA
ncbi:unnamed protein product [Psylliodes chrysocephalus]|uniref:FP protein C-terminal domain-containing protein n=1 Tax=Psylliodes chrysocephalus TaxID=3402493 RepID=A0A9P0D0N2_9CUCU|nr:unnamed protein product [Psylliodes chrysocephala]